MTKRGATYELTQKNVEALLTDFEGSHAAALTKENKTEPSATTLLTREEALRSGRPIIRLKRRLSAPEPSMPSLEKDTAIAQSKADKRASEGAELNCTGPACFVKKCPSPSLVLKAQEETSANVTEASSVVQEGPVGPASPVKELPETAYAGLRRKEQTIEDECCKRQKIEAGETESQTSCVASKEESSPQSEDGAGTSLRADVALRPPSEVEEDQEKTRSNPVSSASPPPRDVLPLDGATDGGASEKAKAGDLTGSDSAVSAQKKGTSGAEPSAATDVPASSSEHPVPSSSSGESQNPSAPSIFGNFFSCPFTNPFAQAAANVAEKDAFASTGKESEPCKAEVSSGSMKPPSFALFPGQSIFSVNSSEIPKPALGTTSEKLDSEVFDPCGEEHAEGQTAATRPAQFLGEEDDKEIFFDNHVTLLKCTPITVEPKEPKEKSVTDEAKNSKSETRVTYKFKKQGEGLLRVLQTPKKEGVPQAPPNDCRLVIRQKGTWNLLLNSPLSLAQRFDIVPQLASGFGLRFVGIDHSHKDAQDPLSATSSPPLAAYCLKFATEGQRRAFLIAAGYPTAS